MNAHHSSLPTHTYNCVQYKAFIILANAMNNELQNYLSNKLRRTAIQYPITDHLNYE